MCVADEELTSGLGVVLVCLFTIVCVCVSVQALVGSSACEPALVRPSSVDQPFFGTGYILVGVCLGAPGDAHRCFHLGAVSLLPCVQYSRTKGLPPPLLQ